MSARAQLWEGGERFREIEVPLPDLRPGEVLVALSAATVCGSDRHTVSGRRPGACPSILGHEGVGIVQDSRREDITRGQRVVFSVTSCCGACRACLRGLSAKCEGVRKTGHEPFDGEWPLSGTYSTHIHLLAGQAVQVVPHDIPDAVASTAGCAVATVMAALEQAGDLCGRSVLITGVGMLGMIAVVAARAGGATHIIASDPDPRIRELVSPLADAVVEPGGHHLVDVALEFSGASAAVQDCLRSLDVGGRAVLAGTVSPVGTVPVDPEWLVRGWRTVTGVHNYEPRHLAEAVAFLSAEGEALPWAHLLHGPVPLDRVPEVFSTAPPAARVIVTPGRSAPARGYRAPR